ncbi:MAG: HTH domain-containing protein, partial [Clostridia bacterium]|nr:HTH domain-containing protein [Clostridia bacterium]
ENVLKEGENVLKEGENVLKEGSTELSRKERDVIVLLKADKTATEKTLAEKIGCAERTVRRVILALIDKGMIKRVGSRKEGYWEISGE